MSNPRLKKICLITPGHLATNPRLVKEASALLEAGYQVHVIFTQYMDYLLVDDEKILNTYTNLTYDKLNWTRNNAVGRIYSGAVQKTCKWLSRLVPKNNLIHKLILNRNYFWQHRKAVSAKASMYISHNLGALPVAADAAKKNKAKCGFDAEDFHRGENISSTEQKSFIFIEDLYIPSAHHLSSASPLISATYQKLYNKEFITILNVFPKQKIQAQIVQKNRPLQLFWFSQTIGMGRGIENIIYAISLLKDKSPVLHILGNADVWMKNKIIKFAQENRLTIDNIIFYDSVSPEEVFDIAAGLDIGIASETGIPINRDICLTNKIFTYLQAGLAVVASNTSAQINLISKFPEFGSIYQNEDIKTLTTILENYQLYPQQLQEAKQNSTLLSSDKFNWEKEKYIFLNMINKCLKND